jgi:small subunit ribosomal protein S20
MANHPSARKRNRQRVKREARNRHARSTVRTAVKQARAALAEGNSEAAAELTRTAKVALARASSKGVMHRKTASRSIGRLQLALNKVGDS